MMQEKGLEHAHGSGPCDYCSHEKLIEEKGKYYQLYTGAFELE